MFSETPGHNYNALEGVKQRLIVTLIADTVFLSLVCVMTITPMDVVHGKI